MKQRLKKLVNCSEIWAEVIYILLRIYGLIYSMLFSIIRIVVPVKENKIVCCNMKGKRFGDNPKYIAESLLELNNQLDIVWLLNEPKKSELPKGMRSVKNSFWRQIYELASAKVWIDSNTKTYGFKKRKNQLYVQTWHGSYGLKKVYGDIPDKTYKIDKETVRYNMRRADIVVSNAKQTTEIFRRAFWYQGAILENGSPRNDLFFDKDVIRECERRVRIFYGVGEKKIALYAPTYRNNQSIESFNVDFDCLLKALEKKFQGEWVILIRLHPENIKQAAGFVQYNAQIMNATDYDVMQELLVASDVLITDYSSCMFDFVTTKKVCFLYASDLENYKQERDNYFDLEDLPFPLATTSEELVVAIVNFDYALYEKKLDELFKNVGLNETGKASMEVAKYILNWMQSN